MIIIYLFFKTSRVEKEAVKLSHQYNMEKLSEIFDIVYGNQFDLNKMLVSDDSSINFVSRGATNLGTSGGITESQSNWSALSMSILDSPSTTSATTYQVYFRASGGTGYLNNGKTASITAFEIAG
jgi:hypothetical protein